MPSQAVRDWLDLFDQKALERNRSVESRPDKRFQLHAPTTPPSIGSVRCSAAASRDELDRSEDVIWLSLEREMERIWAEGDHRVFTVVLDVQSADSYDPERDNFIYIPEDLLVQETTAHGNIGIDIAQGGGYDAPFSNLSNDWSGFFGYLSGGPDDGFL